MQVSADTASSGENQVAVDVYKSIRAHELMLNQATSAYEHATVAPLILVNGGAAIAYLTLVGALSKGAQGLAVSAGYVIAAVSMWGLGLVSAQLMVSHGLSEQRAWSRKERLNRRRVEFHLLRCDVDLQRILFPKNSSESKLADLAEKVDLAEEAKNARRLKSIARSASLTCFAAGLALAAASVI